MCLSKIIQSFLQHRLAINSMSRFTLSKLSGIPYQTISKILNAKRSNYEITTLLKIADFFQCSIDEIVGRDQYIICKRTDLEFEKLQPTDISNNLKNFINTKIHLLSISPYALGLDIGFSQEVIPRFLHANNTRNILSTKMIISLANYFDISIDVMISRIAN